MKQYVRQLEREVVSLSTSSRTIPNQIQPGQMRNATLSCHDPSTFVPGVDYTAESWNAHPQADGGLELPPSVNHSTTDTHLGREPQTLINASNMMDPEITTTTSQSVNGVSGHNIMLQPEYARIQASNATNPYQFLSPMSDHALEPVNTFDTNATQLPWQGYNHDVRGHAIKDRGSSATLSRGSVSSLSKSPMMPQNPCQLLSPESDCTADSCMPVRSNRMHNNHQYIPTDVSGPGGGALKSMKMLQCESTASRSMPCDSSTPSFSCYKEVPESTQHGLEQSTSIDDDSNDSDGTEGMERPWESGSHAPYMAHDQVYTSSMPELVGRKAGASSAPAHSQDASLGVRMNLVLEAVQGLGFSTIEDVVSILWTADFKDQPILADKQRLSRRRMLPEVLAKLREATDSWTNWEAQTYRDEVTRAAEAVLSAECMKFIREKDQNPIMDKSHISHAGVKQLYQNEVMPQLSALPWWLAYSHLLTKNMV